MRVPRAAVSRPFLLYCARSNPLPGEPMSHRALLLVCAAALVALTAVPVQAQECAAFPASRMRVKVTCASADGMCRTGQPIQLQMILWDSPSTPVPSCVTTKIGLWTTSPLQSYGPATTVTGGEPTTRTVDTPGTYIVVANVTSSPPQTTALTNYSFVAGSGTVQIALAAGTRIDEGSSATFSITRTNDEKSTVVTWRAYELSSQVFYVPTAAVTPPGGTVTYEPGERSKQVTLTAVENSTFTGDRVYYVALDSASNGYVVPANGYIPFTITDNDLAFLELAQTSTTARENAGSVNVAVRRTGNLTLAVSVPYTVQFDGVLTTAGQVAFAPGETLKTFNIPIADNQQWSPEPARAFISLGEPSRGGSVVASSASLLIEEDEPVPSLTVSELTIPESDSGRRSGAFLVRMTPAVTRFLVNYDLIDGSAKFGSDYSGTQHDVLHFDATHSQFSIPFEILGDMATEAHETFKLHLVRVSTDIPQIAIPADTGCTILNDDAELTPGNTRISRGQSMKFSVDIGLPPTAPIEIPLRVSDSSILSLPGMLRFNPGQSTASFTVTGSAAGSTKISLLLPPENGGQTLSSSVNVHESGTAVFEPGALTIFTGEEATIRISLKPASAVAERLQLTTGNANIATVMSEVVIPAGGTGTVTLKALSPGASFLKAFLPPLFGEGYAMTSLDVIDRPPTPAITAIEPASGSSAGGTPFIARGALLMSDCTLLFGNVPAASLTLSSDGMLIG